MASPSEIAQGLPETLPADFSDWDSEASPAAALGNSGGFETAPAFAEPPKPPRQSAEREAISRSVVDRPSEVRSPSFLPVSTDYDDFLHREKLVSSLLDRLPSPASYPTTLSSAAKEYPIAPSRPNAAALSELLNTPDLMATLTSQADSASVLPFPSDREAAGEHKKPGTAWMIVAFACAFAILLLLILAIPVLNSGMAFRANQSLQASQGAAGAQLNSNPPRWLYWRRLIQDKPLTTTQAQPVTDSQPSHEAGTVNPISAQTEMMNEQLAAPTRIPKDIASQVAANAPPSPGFAAPAADALGGSGELRGVFSEQTQPTVTVAGAHPLATSAGVTAGLLIRKSAPIYPSIAIQAKVSGNVELQATITTNGTIKNVRVLSGPPLLRQAAVNAVRTWRYKPYRLNNQPIEVQTIINVVFSLGG